MLLILDHEKARRRAPSNFVCCGGERFFLQLCAPDPAASSTHARGASQSARSTLGALVLLLAAANYGLLHLQLIARQIGLGDALWIGRVTCTPNRRSDTAAEDLASAPP